MPASTAVVNDHLTVPQRRAVEHAEGPLLILAGPGSGKTRVITHRIARLCERGVSPHNILAITFTNKAANEMAERVNRLIPGERVWISTFHRFCARMLRARGHAVGLEANYTIFDTGDQTQLIRQILHDLDIDSVSFPPRKIGSRISKAKNDLQSSDDVKRKFADSVGNHMEGIVAKVYPEYQKRLLQSNAVDFDDLLLHVVTLLSESETLRRQIGERYRFILVDEYQDTNLAQYKIVTALAESHHNLCVTGDPDQSIYGWRGARIDNILRFEQDFPNAEVVRLEQNFRSTKQILKAADELIANNVQRKAKSLLTDNADGEPVQLLRFADGLCEADGIARDIEEAVAEGGRNWSDFAIVYRVNALSREIERALTRHRIPFQVAAGVAFYDRAEIKDVLAYLRLIFNPNDEMAFRRVVNVPKRGIGKTTIGRLAGWAHSQGITLFEAASRADEIPKLSKRPVNALTKFAQLIGELSLEETKGVADLLHLLLERSEYVDEWRHSGNEKDEQRLANVEELITAAKQYDRSTDEPTLEGFLETTSLVNEVDGLDEATGSVTLMTLHAAKGLEYPVLYVVGVEQNLIPHERSLKSDDYRELEEERRLLFVGMTRAEEELYLTQCWKREFRGRTLHTIPSDFLQEFGTNSVDRMNGESDSAFDSQIDPYDASDEIEQTYLTVAEARRTISQAKLMTGSDLLNGTDSSPEIPDGFGVGELVRHPRYGQGTILQVGGFAKRRTLTVEFTDGRQETFIADKSPLQPVGL